MRDTDATFLTDLDELRPLVPEKAEVVPDDSPQFRRRRLWLEAVLRKTAVPLHDERLIVSHRMLLDELGYRRRAVAQAEDDGFPFEALRGDLFAQAAISLIEAPSNVDENWDPRPVRREFKASGWETSACRRCCGSCCFPGRGRAGTPASSRTRSSASTS
ncbi:hypothetical protein [Saccharopolyspora pogona]|uniref:hypothetical protein n=1 Tax=Saccharopolyspora pogona TaxID=333966 RepID=UPI00168A33FB|nr:hypothetical protein [Saccharopolyspora pogona]